MKRFLLTALALSLFSFPAFANPETGISCEPMMSKKRTAKNAEIHEETDSSRVLLSGAGEHRVIRADLMTPSAGYRWSLAGMSKSSGKTVVNIKLLGPGEGMMAAQVITPVTVSLPITLKPDSKSVIMRLDKDFKWGARGFTCVLPQAEPSPGKPVSAPVKPKTDKQAIKESVKEPK